MIPLRAALVGTALLASTVLASCGSGATADNDSCPYDSGISAYDPNPPITNGNPVGQYIPEMPHTHVDVGTTVHYEHNPPTSGCHYAVQGVAPVARGVYTKEIPPEYWVHNLEHGYIVVLYNCPTGCAADFDSIRKWASTLQPDPELVAAGVQNPYVKVVVLPYKEMQPRFAAVSWDYYDPMSKLDTAELQRFYDNHAGADPEGHAAGQPAG